MKAAVYYGIKDIRIEEIETPVCRDNEIKIKVHYCAICGTDVRIYLSGHKKVIPPAVIGHEITGVVEEIGRDVRYPEPLKVGDRITTVTSIGCGKCKMCRKGFYNLCPDTKAIGYFYPGGYAEYLIIPATAVEQRAVIKLPEGVSLKEGALIEPLSCVINGQNYLNIGTGDTVVIYGGGPIGFMHAVIAQAKGAEKVIMIDPAYERLEKFGKNFRDLILLNPKKVNVKDEILHLTGGYGADVVITACPAKQAQVEGLEILGSKGRISLFGGLPKDDSFINIDANLIHYKELSVFGAFASNRDAFIKAAKLISEKKIEVEKFISSVVPLEKINEGIEMVRAGEVLKCVVEINKG
ncbi:MAG: alcohol dehydrogenase catalytic domain-containing protein [Candidatus Omnitrophica bacterium]|nr:alcohol dehydrogenase catalytic domain-containing protein [Candidatus Omnitrophota bacterium]